MESPVYSVEILWAMGAAIAIVGLWLGWLAGRRTSGTAKKYQDVSRKLDQVMQDKKTYENEVVEHFTETAKLLNNLTDSYREVHNQLATGAAALCQGEGPISLERTEDNIRSNGNSGPSGPYPTPSRLCSKKLTRGKRHAQRGVWPRAQATGCSLREKMGRRLISSRVRPDCQYR